VGGSNGGRAVHVERQRVADVRQTGVALYRPMAPTLCAAEKCRSALKTQVTGDRLLFYART